MKPKIAFVDDEPAMHEMVRSILRIPRNTQPLDLFDNGQSVAEESHGEEFPVEFFDCPLTARDALKKAYQEGNPFHLLVTDVRMPKKDGIWLVEEARRIDPRIRLIVFTAYADFSMETLKKKAGNPSFIYLEKIVPPLVFKQAVESELATWIELYQDRRQSKRVRTRHRVSFHFPEELEGELVDATTNGIKVVDVSIEIAADQPVSLRFPSLRVEAIGQVRWVKQEGDRFRLGIQFEETQEPLFTKLLQEMDNKSQLE